MANASDASYSSNAPQALSPEPVSTEQILTPPTWADGARVHSVNGLFPTRDVIRGFCLEAEIPDDEASYLFPDLTTLVGLVPSNQALGVHVLTQIKGFESLDYAAMSAVLTEPSMDANARFSNEATKLLGGASYQQAEAVMPILEGLDPSQEENRSEATPETTSLPQPPRPRGF